MDLEFKKLTREGILKLAENPCPECELAEMSGHELEVLNERINKLASRYPADQKLYAKLMRLKSFTMLENRS